MKYVKKFESFSISEGSTKKVDKNLSLFEDVKFR